MSKLEELIKELCPQGVEYKEIDEVCEISRGIVMSKDFKSSMPTIEEIESGIQQLLENNMGADK